MLTLSLALLIASKQVERQAPLIWTEWSIIVEAKLDGQLGWFMLDTGSALSLLDESFFKRVQSDSTKLATSFGGKELYRVPKLQVGGAALTSVSFAPGMPTTTEAFTSGLKIKLSGVLGYNALRMFCFGIDFDLMQAQFWNPSEGDSAQHSFFGPHETLTSTPVITEDGWPWIQVKFNDRPFYVVLDTASTYASVPGKASNWLGDEFLSGKTVAVFGQDRTLPDRTVFPRSVELDGAKILCPPVLQDSRDEDPAIVGCTMFAQLHKVLFDLDGGVVRFPKPDSSLEGANLPLRTYGVQVLSDRALHRMPWWTSGPSTPVPLDNIIQLGDAPFLNPRVNEADWRSRANVVRGIMEKSMTAPKIALRVRMGKSVRQVVLGNAGVARIDTRFVGGSADTAFDPGPGVYLIDAGKAPVKLAPGAFQRPRGGQWRLIGIGGVRKPALRLSAGSELVRFTVPPVEEPADFDSDGFSAQLPGSVTVKSFDDFNYPLLLACDAVVKDIGGRMLVPYDEDLVIYYPSGWKIPRANQTKPPSGAYPPPPGLPESGCVWIWLNGEWGQDYERWEGG